MLKHILKAIEIVPQVRPHLTGKARFLACKAEAYKSAEYFQQQLTRNVIALYNGNITGEFIDLLGNLISGQLLDAYQAAWVDEENVGLLPDYLTEAYTADVLNQYTFVDQYYRDIIDARLDGTPIEPLLARAGMWSQQWTTSYRKAVELIRLQGGGNLMWQKGETEKGCSTCANLDGIVMSAKEWAQLGVHPRGYPNSKLQCEGGGPVNNCDCELVPTDQRRSAGAYGKVEEIIL